MAKALARSMLEKEVGYILEIIDMIEEFKATGRDLNPEDIAEDVIDEHIEGLDGVESKDRDFFLHYARREVAEEAAALLAPREVST